MHWLLYRGNPDFPFVQNFADIQHHEQIRIAEEFFLPQDPLHLQSEAQAHRVVVKHLQNPPDQSLSVLR